MKRHIYIAILVLAFGLFAIGCGGGGNSATTVGGTSSTPTVVNDTSPPPPVDSGTPVDNDSSPAPVDNGGGTPIIKVDSSETMELVTISSNVGSIKAAIRVSGGNAADYFIVGMIEQATAGFDNAHDTVAMSPEGWNTNYIFTYMDHPEWMDLEDQYRGDLRNIQSAHEWLVNIETDLSVGTALTMSVIAGKSRMNSNYSLMVNDMSTGNTVDIASGNYNFTVDASGAMQFKVNATAVGSTVSGALIDSNQDAVAGASVKINNATFTKVTSSGADGGFALSGVPAGEYTLSASKSGYQALSTSYKVN